MAKVKFFDKVMGWRQKQRVAYDGLLADQEALNLGTLFDVAAQPENALGLDKFGQPVRLLNIEGEDADSETVTITIQNEATFLAQTTIPVPGPVIGIVEFGTGSGYARMEFEIPSAIGGPASNLPGLGINLGNIFTPQKNNAVTLVLPASSIRVFARNDAQTGFLVDFDNTKVNGSLVSRTTPAQVRVHAAYGRANMIREKVFREYMIAGPGAPLPVLALGVGVISIGVPAFAKRVTFPRTPIQTSSLTAIFSSYYSASTTGTITIGPNDMTSFELPPHTSTIILTNTGPAAFSALSALFELGF